MAIQARVTSTEAPETLRAALIVFITKARQNVDETSDAVRRTRSWLQNDQMTRWEGELRRRHKALDQAQAELRSAQFAGNRESAVMTRQAAVNRAKQAIAEAEDKLRRVKKWNQNYDHTTDPVVKKLEGFRAIVDVDLPKAVAHLRNVQRALEAYADTEAPMAGSAPSTEPPAAGETAPAAAPAPEAPAP